MDRNFAPITLLRQHDIRFAPNVTALEFIGKCHDNRLKNTNVTFDPLMLGSLGGFILHRWCFNVMIPGIPLVIAPPPVVNTLSVTFAETDRSSVYTTNTLLQWLLPFSTPYHQRHSTCDYHRSSSNHSLSVLYLGTITYGSYENRSWKGSRNVNTLHSKSTTNVPHSSVKCIVREKHSIH